VIPLHHLHLLVTKALSLHHLLVIFHLFLDLICDRSRILKLLSILALQGLLVPLGLSLKHLSYNLRVVIHHVWLGKGMHDGGLVEAHVHDWLLILCLIVSSKELLDFSQFVSHL